ncbi:hypothetical protein NEUTE1DRAFT_39527, partial [Neurospora tetrasperma FGSC 2508]
FSLKQLAAAKREGQKKNASGPLRCKDRNSQWHRDCLVYRQLPDSNLSNEKSVSNHVKTFRPAARLDCRGLAEDAEGWGWRAGRAGKHRKTAE